MDLDDPTPQNHEHRIYGDDNASVWAVVDAEDYAYFSQWRWCPTKACRIARRKTYLRRQIGNRTLYLHVEIMQRVEPAPSPAHIIVDHMNGNSLDCRRANLRWATPSQNAKNKFGSYTRQLELVA
jgi:hypothetical protein